MAAQVLSYRVLRRADYPYRINQSDVRGIVSNMAQNLGGKDYAKHPAFYIDRVFRSLKDHNSLTFMKDDSISCPKLATLYLIDKAYDQFVFLVDYMKSIGEYRFLLKRFSNEMNDVFKKYHRLRDRNSYIDPVLFSDAMDIYEEKYGERIESIKESIDDYLKEKLTLPDNQRNMAVLFLLIYTLIICAENNRDYISNYMSYSFACSSKMYEFIDFKKVYSVSLGAIHAICKISVMDIDLRGQTSEHFNKLCRDLLMDNEIIKQIESMKHETGDQIGD